MVSGKLARSRQSGPGDTKVVNEKFDKELNKQLNGFREASQI